MGSRKAAAAALTLAVLAVSCGAGDATDVAVAPTPTEIAAPATTAPGQSADTVTSAAPPEGPVAPIQSAFPDLTVADVASGSQITLREAAGTGTPVMMWFWFPH